MSGLMVMAGGTGGHVIPALAVAEILRERGVKVTWVGNVDGIEGRLVPAAGFTLDFIHIKGLRRSGIIRKLTMPFMLLYACVQALKIILKQKPDALLGMGGFVSGPGGLVGRLLGKPLVLHEQNAVAGLTNRWLAKLSGNVLSGFPKASGIDKVNFVGNPVRASISRIDPPKIRMNARRGPLRLLVIGGSQGALVFNKYLPSLLADSRFGELEIRHQCGRGRLDGLEDAYTNVKGEITVSEFIDDMAEAYRWCDLVICRSGAMTVSEVSCAGVAALFVPYPYAVNDHQTRNAQYLVEIGGAMISAQSDFIEGNWIDQVATLSSDRNQLVEMATCARQFAKPDAANQVANICGELIHA